jgi:D-cysteine desulfhydrase
MPRPLPVELPRFRLAQLPTPLHDAPRLARAIGVARVLVKRDDLTGFAAGGNKVRKMEFLVGDALARGADTIIAVGGPQSNAVRTAMIAARAAGLEPIAVMYGDPPPVREGNLVLDDLAGARLAFTGDADRTTMEPAAEALAAELRAAGRHPYVIPRGGATAVGDAGYVEASAELADQLAALGAAPAHLVVATGSCGTQAGLIAGAAWLGVPYHVIGILVSRPRSEAVPRLLELARSTAELLGLGVAIGPDDVRVDDRFLGPGFGIPSPEGIAAQRLALATEGLVLDATYTAKALAGLIGLINDGTITPDASLIFVHTGGDPAVYAHRSSAP